MFFETGGSGLWREVPGVVLAGLWRKNECAQGVPLGESVICDGRVIPIGIDHQRWLG